MGGKLHDAWQQDKMAVAKYPPHAPAPLPEAGVSTCVGYSVQLRDLLPLIAGNGVHGDVPPFAPAGKAEGVHDGDY